MFTITVIVYSNWLQHRAVPFLR